MGAISIMPEQSCPCVHSHIDTLQSKTPRNESNKLHQSMHSFDSTSGLSANTALLVWEHLPTATAYVQLWLSCICRQAHAEFSTFWDSAAKQDGPVSTLITKLSSNNDCGHKRGQQRVVRLPLTRGWPSQPCRRVRVQGWAPGRLRCARQAA